MAKRKPKLFRRLRVVRDDADKTNSRALRDVYLESSLEPWKLHSEGGVVPGEWKIELAGLQLPCVQVVDMVKWAESLNISIEYDPPQNMARWFSKKAQESDLQYLFDIG